jgi:hypothetical protein
VNARLHASQASVCITLRKFTDRIYSQVVLTRTSFWDHAIGTRIGTMYNHKHYLYKLKNYSLNGSSTFPKKIEKRGTTLTPSSTQDINMRSFLFSVQLVYFVSAPMDPSF